MITERSASDVRPPALRMTYFYQPEQLRKLKYMSIAFLQAEGFCGVDARIHTRDDDDFPRGRKRQISLVKGVCVFRIRLFKFVGNRHIESFGERRRLKRGSRPIYGGGFARHLLLPLLDHVGSRHLIGGGRAIKPIWLRERL